MNEHVDMEEVEYASFWRRLGALLIDLAIINVLLRILMPFKHDKLPKISHRFNWIFDISMSLPGLFDVFAEFAYFVFFWAKGRQTIGQHVMGIRTVLKDGEQLTYVNSIVRFIGFLVSGSILGFGFLWILTDQDNQGILDKMAGTAVIRTKKSTCEVAGEA